MNRPWVSGCMPVAVIRAAKPEMRPPPPRAMADRAVETLPPIRRRRSWHTALRYVLHREGETP